MWRGLTPTSSNGRNMAARCPYEIIKVNYLKKINKNFDCHKLSCEM